MKELDYNEVNKQPEINTLSQKEILEEYYIKNLQESISMFIIGDTYGNKTLKNAYGDRLPRVSVTLNNKIMLLNKEFKEKGMSLFVTTYDYSKYGLSKEYTAKSFVGDAIIHDLWNMTIDAEKELAFCNQGLVMEKQLKNTSPTHNLFSKIRGLFVSNKQINTQSSVEKESKMSFNNFMKKNNDIWEYNLEDNLVQSLVNEITAKTEDGEHIYKASDVPGLIEENVMPDLKKLGYEHLEPELQDMLVEKYKQDLIESKGLEVEKKDMHLYVPEFSKEKTNNFKEQYKSDLTLEEQKEQSERLHEQAKQKSEELKKLESR